MPPFASTDQLYASLKLLFSRIVEQDPQATQAVVSARMAICLRCSQPRAEIFINGRTRPVQISYGAVSLRPDLDIELTAETLHRILLGELRLRNAIANGLMKVKGPVWKTTALESILHRGQALYPDVLRDQGYIL